MDKRAIIIAGVAGSGKTSLARALAKKIAWQFVEADDYHTAQSKQKMASGKPLNDDDRAPWLSKLNQIMQKQAPAVLACSALKQGYREALSQNLETRFIWLTIERDAAYQRIAARTNHYMPASLIDSQFTTAEPLLKGIVLDASKPLTELTEIAYSKIKDFINPYSQVYNIYNEVLLLCYLSL